MIFTFPGALQVYKAPLFIFVAGLALIKIALSKKTGLVSCVLILCSIFVFRGIWGTTIGILNHTPGVFRLIPIYIFWNILYIIFISLISKTSIFNVIIKSLIIGSFIVALVDILFIFQVLNFIPSNINPFTFYYDIYEPYDYSFAFGYSHGKSIEFLAYNINLLFFSYPFLLGLFLLYKPKKSSFWTNKITLLILLALSTMVVFLSNRRMLILIMLFSPFILAFFARFLQKKKRKKIYKTVFTSTIIAVLIVGFLLINYATVLDIDIENLIYEFQKLSDKNVDPRFNQSTRLIEYWLEAPLVGQGAGASIPGYLRNQTSIWAYELSYHLHLMQFGIIGFALELIFYLGIFFYGIKIIKKKNDSLMAALLAGCFGLLIANATNPYTNSLDFLWPLFLPLAYINLSMLKNKEALAKT